MSLSDCTPCCSTPVSTAVPGPQGNSAVTATTASFVIPAIGSNVSNPSPGISVGNTTYFLAGENVYIGDGSKFGNFQITSIDSTTHISVKFLGFVGDSATGSTITSGALVVGGVGNYTVPWDMDAFTAFTDNSGGSKSDTINATVARQTVVFGPWNMTTLANAQNWNISVPFAFTLISLTFRCDMAITTGAKTVTFTPAINAVNTGGGTLVVAGTYALKATTTLNVTAPNTGTAGQTIELPTSGVTAFSEGYGHIDAVVRNDDLNASIAAFADKMNTLRTRLRHQ